MTLTRAVIILAALPLAACSRPAGGPSASASPSPDAMDAARPLPSPVPEIVARVNGQPIGIRQILPMAKTELERLPEAERDQKKPEVLRRALQEYIDRELLLQEALARGLHADSSRVEWSYDQLRQGHADEAAWKDFLARQGLDGQSFKAELRAQHTVAALLEQEVQAWPVPDEEARAAFAANPGGFGPPDAKSPPAFEAVRGEVEAVLRQEKREEIHAALLARLRARARIETYL